MSRTAIILSGGLGARLKPFTEVIPKPLLPIGEKAVLEIQIERLKKNGFDHIVLATNYKSNYIEHFFGDGERYGVKLEISKEEKPLGTVGPLKLLEHKLKEPFILMNGDVLSLLNFRKFYDFACSKDSFLSVTIKKIIVPYAFGNIGFEGDFVTNIEEKPDLITYALAGIYVIKPKLLYHIPNNQYYGMDSLIKYMLFNDFSITKYEHKEYWLDIGQIEDYQKAQHIYNDYFLEEWNGI